MPARLLLCPTERGEKQVVSLDVGAGYELTITQLIAQS